MASAAKGMLAGGVAGLAGAWAMNVYGAAVTRLKQAWSGRTESSSGDDATVRAGAALSKALLHHTLTPREKRVAGPAVHFAMGALSGALYGLIAELVPSAGRDRGLGLGSALWLGADELSVPLLRLSGPPWRYPVSAHLQALGAHLVYGVTTDRVRRLVRATF